MEEKVLLKDSWYKSSLSEGIKAFQLIYAIDIRILSIASKEEVIGLIVDILKGKEFLDYENILILLLDKLELNHEDFDFRKAREELLKIIYITPDQFRKMSSVITQNADFVKQNYFISRKVLDYFDNQLFFKILDVHYNFLNDIILRRIIPEKKVKIKISSRTYNLLYSDIDENSRYESFFKDLGMWIFSNGMMGWLKILEEEDLFIVVEMF